MHYGWGREEWGEGIKGGSGERKRSVVTLGLYTVRARARAAMSSFLIMLCLYYNNMHIMPRPHVVTMQRATEFPGI